MTQQQFYSLDHTSKILLLTEMPHIGERFEPEHTILLFQMNGWLLEAYYHRRAGVIHFETVTHHQQLHRFVLLERRIVLPDGTISSAGPGLLAYNWRKFAAWAKPHLAGIQQFFALPGLRQAPTRRRIA